MSADQKSTSAEPAAKAGEQGSASKLSQAERLAKAKAAAAKAKALRDKALQQAKDSAEPAKVTEPSEPTEQAASSSQSQSSSADTSTGPSKEALAAKLEQAKKLKAAKLLKDAQKAKAQAQGQSKEADAAAETQTAEKAEPAADAKTEARKQLRDKKVPAKTSQSKPKMVSSLDDFTEVEGVKELVHPKVKQPSLWEIFIKGIWKDNPGLCQLLGMCPLLAVTTSAANALGLGMATIIVMVLSSMVISLLRRFIMPEVRIPLYVMIIASLVTVVRIEVEAYFPSLYQQLGIYLSLIVTNCIIMARAEAFAGKNNLIRSTVDAIACSIGFTLVLFALGCVREIIGNGTLFMGATDVLGAWAKDLETQVLSADRTLLIAILPPGGFFILAMFIAGKNFLDGIARRRAENKMRIRAIQNPQL